MSKYVVDNKVPMPTSAKRNSYPFGEMKVGDSFLAPNEDQTAIRSAASWYGKRTNQKFAVRRTKDGYRCWRVE